MPFGFGCGSKRPRDDTAAAAGSATSGKRPCRTQTLSAKEEDLFAGARVVMEEDNGAPALARILALLAGAKQSKGSNSCSIMANMALRMLLQRKHQSRFQMENGLQHNLTTADVFDVLVKNGGIELARPSANSRRSERIPRQILRGWPDIVSELIIGSTDLCKMSADKLESTTCDVLKCGGMFRHLPLPRADKVARWTPESFAKAFAKALVADANSHNCVTTGATPQWHSQAIVAVTGDGKFWICLQTWSGSMITLVPRLSTEELREGVRSVLLLEQKKKKILITVDAAMGKVGQLWKVMVPDMLANGPTDLRGAIDRLAVPAMGAPVPHSGAAPPPSALKKLASMVPTCLSQVLDKVVRPS